LSSWTTVRSVLPEFSDKFYEFVKKDNEWCTFQTQITLLIKDYISYIQKK
jgi:hypothetical protein